MLLGEADGVMVGTHGLDDHPARFLAPAGPAGDLGDQLEGLLRRPEIRHIESAVGPHHPDQGDMGEMVALGDHLGADQDIDLPRPHRLEDLQKVPAVGGGIGIKTGDAGLGQEQPRLLFDPLGAESDGHQEPVERQLLQITR